MGMAYLGFQSGDKQTVSSLLLWAMAYLDKSASGLIVREVDG
ncbi:hypothetical protein Golob_014394 [Gossypium lobatum]|uniref:Uncharacterized protein n=1 Tax=Gossypium lobatum TaxID=34289 RepID=A0A7J8LXZ0_9ROSI|nr:hypothetical protein [Gossypium lobatum]